MKRGRGRPKKVAPSLFPDAENDHPVVEKKKPKVPTVKPKNRTLLSTVDKEDRVALAGKPRGYIIGWNKVKYKHSSET